VEGIFVPRPRHIGVTILVFIAACSGAHAPEQDEASGVLTIESHEDGDTVGTPSIQIVGTAPADAEIVHDKAFARDARTSADSSGDWRLTVDLDEGANDLTFRIGDDEATSKTIRINYEPEVAATREPAAPTQAATEPTPQPAATPAPTPAVVTFGGGDLVVGTNVQPGTYRTRTAQSFCYWERVSGFGGTLDEIIANGTGSGYFTVTIGAGDAGFNSTGCGTWSADLSAVIDPAGPITEDGVFIVGTDVEPGTWQSKGGDEFGCYMARRSGFGGTLDEVIANDISLEGGLVVTIAPTDVGFETSGCGTWTKVG
jgi:hypothetical protein